MSRPGRLESQRRTREFVRLILAGYRLRQAAEQARVNPSRALSILDDLAECGVVSVGERAA